MNFISSVKTEIESNEYRDETAATVANVFFYNASGHINRGYHVEFSFDSLTAAQNFATVLASYDMFPKLLERKQGRKQNPTGSKNFLVYLKSGECICNLLALIGAKNALMELHNHIALRDVVNNANRRANCDTANIAKTVTAATAQVEQIQKLLDGNRATTLSPKLRETALARIQNSEMSYEELAAVLGITKSGLVNRIKKLLKT